MNMPVDFNLDLMLKIKALKVDDETAEKVVDVVYWAMEIVAQVLTKEKAE